MFASRKRVETLVGGGARHTRTHRSRIIHEDVRLHPFLLRGARLRQGTSLARVHGARAKPDRRDGRRRLRCRVFVAPASRRAGRADETTGFRANAVDARRPRAGNRSVKPPHPPSWGIGAPPLRPDPRDAGRDPNPLIRVWRSTTVWLRFFLLPRRRATTTNDERRTTNDAHLLPAITITITHRSPRARPLFTRAAAAPSR